MSFALSCLVLKNLWDYFLNLCVCYVLFGVVSVVVVAVL